MLKQTKLRPFNNVGQIMVSVDQLPLCCPLPDQTVWNAHPRVYLPITETGKAICPYCSAHFILKDFDHSAELLERQTID